MLVLKCVFLTASGTPLSAAPNGTWFSGVFYKQNGITIGSNVWIASDVHVMNHAAIGNGCIVAAGSYVTRKIEGDNLLIAGIPAEKKKEGVRWER